MEEPFEVSVVQREGVPVVHAVGEVDVSTAPALRDRLVEIADRVSRIVVDLSEVTFLDSTGLGVLVAGQKRLRSAHEPVPSALSPPPDGDGDGRLDLIVTRPQILKVLEVTGLTTLFRIYPDLDGAFAK